MTEWAQPASFPARTAPPKAGIRVAERFKGVKSIADLEDGGQEGPFPNQHPRVKVEGKPQEKEHFLSIQIILPASIQETLSKVVTTATAHWPKSSYKPIEKKHLHLTLAGDLVALWGLKSKKEYKVEDDVLAEVKKRTHELIQKWRESKEAKNQPKLRWTEVTFSKSDLNTEVEGNEGMRQFFNFLRDGTNQKWELYQKSTTVVRYLLPQRAAHASLSDEEYKKLYEEARVALKAELVKTEKIEASCQEGLPAELDVVKVVLTNGDYLADDLEVLETYDITPLAPTHSEWTQPATSPARTAPPKTGIRVAERFKGVKSIADLEDGGQEGPFPNQHPRVKIEGKPQEKEHFLSIQIILPATAQSALSKIAALATAHWPKASYKLIESKHYHVTLAGDLVALWGLKSEKKLKVEDDVLAEVKKKTQELIQKWRESKEAKNKAKIRWTEITFSKSDLNTEVEGNEAMRALYEVIKNGTNQKWELYNKSTTVVRYLLPQKSDHATLSDEEYKKLYADAKAALKADLIKTEKLEASCQEGLPAELEVEKVYLTNGDYLADSYEVLETYDVTPLAAATTS